MNTKNLFAKISMLWLFVFSVLPALILFILGFMQTDLEALAKLPFTLNNYADLFTRSFIQIAGRSLFLAGISTFICFMLAYPFCYCVLRHRYKTLILILILIPFWTSSVIRTYAMVDLLKMHGTINQILNIFGIGNLSLLYTNTAVLLGLIYNLLPLMILPILNAMEAIDLKCIEAAKDLGANRWQVFQKVFWPQSKTGVNNGIIMVFLPAMTLFYIPNILGGAKSMMLGNLIQNQFMVLNNWPQGAATSSFLSLILIVLFYFSQRKARP